MLNKQQINIIEKAFPYMPANSKPILDVLIKANQLMDCIDHASHQDFHTCDIKNNPPVNIEGMLRELRPICSKKDLGYIDTILSFIRTKNILSAYHGMNGDYGGGTNDGFINDLFKNTKYESEGGSNNE